MGGKDHYCHFRLRAIHMQFHFPISPRPVISDYDHHLPHVVMQLDPIAPTISVTQINVPTDEYTVPRVGAVPFQSARARAEYVRVSCFAADCGILNALFCVQGCISPPCTSQLSPSLLTGTEKPRVKAARRHPRQSTCVY